MLITFKHNSTLMFCSSDFMGGISSKKFSPVSISNVKIFTHRGNSCLSKDFTSWSGLTYLTLKVFLVQQLIPSTCSSEAQRDSRRQEICDWEQCSFHMRINYITTFEWEKPSIPFKTKGTQDFQNHKFVIYQWLGTLNSNM